MLRARAHKPNVLDARARAVEARGRLDEVEVRRGREHARGDDLVRAELGRLEDEFEEGWVRRLQAQRRELGVDGGVEAFLELGVVEDDVEFGGAGLEGEFCFSGIVSQWFCAWRSGC